MRRRNRYCPGSIINRWEILEEIPTEKTIPSTEKNASQRNNARRTFRVRHTVTNEEFVKKLGNICNSPGLLLSECAYFTNHTGRENEYYKVIKLMNDRVVGKNCAKSTTWLVYDKVLKEERIMSIVELNQLFKTNTHRYRKRKKLAAEFQYLAAMFRRIRRECGNNPKYNRRYGAVGYTFDSVQWPSCHEFIRDVLEDIGHTPHRESFTLQPKEGKAFRKGNLQWVPRVRNLRPQ